MTGNNCKVLAGIVLATAFKYIRTTTRNGGLFVVRHGWILLFSILAQGRKDMILNTGI